MLQLCRIFVLSLFLFATSEGFAANKACEEALSSGVVRSYISLVQLYLKSNPNEVLAITDRIHKSESFLNPLENKIGTQALQISGGIKLLQKRGSTKDWQDIRIEILKLEKTLITIQDSTLVAREETSAVFDPKVISYVNNPERAWGPIYFTQNGRSFVVMFNYTTSIYLYEIINDKISFLKEIEIPFEVSGIRVVMDQDRVLLVAESIKAVSFFKRFRLAVFEFRDLDLTPLAERFFVNSYTIRDLTIHNKDLYISLLYDGSKIQTYRLQKALLGSEYKLTYLSRFSISNYSSFQSIDIQDNGKLFQIFEYKKNHKVKDEETNLVIRQLDKGLLRSSENEYAIQIKAQPIAFELSGHLFIALGTFNAQKVSNMFQVYRFANGQVELINEIEVPDEIISIFHLEGTDSFIVNTGSELFRIDLRDKKLVQAAHFKSREYIQSNIEIIHDLDRHFLNLSFFDNLRKQYYTQTYEVAESGFSKTLDICERCAVMPSSQVPGQNLLIQSKGSTIQLIRILNKFKR